jgi:hypothetical protein
LSACAPYFLYPKALSSIVTAPPRTGSTAKWPFERAAMREDSLLVAEAGAIVSSDRRQFQRFPIKRDVYYSVNGKSATGTSIDISTSGILLAAAKELPSLGEIIKLSLDWPVALDHRVRLKLSVTGQVVRVQGNKFAVAIRRYEFRTAGRRAAVAVG